MSIVFMSNLLESSDVAVSVSTPYSRETIVTYMQSGCISSTHVRKDTLTDSETS